MPSGQGASSLAQESVPFLVWTDASSLPFARLPKRRLPRLLRPPSWRLESESLRVEGVPRRKDTVSQGEALAAQRLPTGWLRQGLDALG